MFQAAGKEYRGKKDLMKEKTGSFKSPWLMGNESSMYRDIHGRSVMHMQMRFPCFDSFDFMYEDRYFHWYFIRWEEGVALVYTRDDEDKVKVIDRIDPRNLWGTSMNQDHIKELKACGFLEEAE